MPFVINTLDPSQKGASFSIVAFDVKVGHKCAFSDYKLSKEGSEINLENLE